jgi:HEAT repeat protein
MAMEWWRFSGALSGGLVLSLLLATTTAADPPTSDFTQQIVKLIGNKDREFRAAGLEQVRTSARNPGSTQLFADQLKTVDADGQVALLNALADRGDNAARPAVLELISSSPDESVRAAAISVLGKLGGPNDLPLLIKTLSAGSSAERNAARKSLIALSGDSMNMAIGAQLQAASPATKATLIDVLATRRATDQLPPISAATLDEDAIARRAAMRALAQIGTPEQIPQMLAGVLKAQKGSEREQAEKAVAFLCDRIENEEQRAAAVIAALSTVDAAQRDQLLSLVGRVGGRKLVDFVAKIATSDDAARRQLGIDALSKWPDASVADKLLEITTHATDPAERSLAFRGFIKVSAARDHRSDHERLDRMKQAMQAAQTPEEVALVINRVRTAYDIDALRFVLPYLDQPQFSQIACETVVEIAHHREVRDPNKTEVDQALDKVIKVSKDAVVVERANRYKRGETWQRPVRRSRL